MGHYNRTGINTLLIQRVLAEPQHQQAMQPEDWLLRAVSTARMQGRRP